MAWQESCIVLVIVGSHSAKDLLMDRLAPRNAGWAGQAYLLEPWNFTGMVDLSKHRHWQQVTEGLSSLDITWLKESRFQCLLLILT